MLESLSGRGYALVTVCDPRVPDDPGAVHVRVNGGKRSAAILPHGGMDAVYTTVRTVLRNDRAATVALNDGRIALVEPMLPPPTL